MQPEIDFSTREQIFHICLAALTTVLVVTALGIALVASHEQAHSDQLTKYKICHKLDFSVPTAVQALFDSNTVVENKLCDAKTSREFEHSNVSVLSDVFLAGPKSDTRFLFDIGYMLSILAVIVGVLQFTLQDSRAKRLLMLYSLATILGGVIFLMIGLQGIAGSLYAGDVSDLIGLVGR